ncbi:cobalamin B12-binding domain-containing protein [Alkalibacter saccharofermentans]|uniref:Methanogenic corrinoid protein MtbC1 n=1 Tax=Alkalibacter saccharofermentans DSM 14828 TaxID=1120975 RepID=A0A1M5A430_9FIRM|nr:cobalamin-dependent protein [Alkalibacter saccharofermentans]SHF24847.1 Methanogenic corrinoid protein MtbC1 [Alkalibacter saccharofermentans DSM 14828]
MSLLVNYTDQRYVEIAQKVFQEQFKRDPKLEKELDERRKRLMYEDVVYNISFLMTAVHFSDGKIFEGYAIWIYELLCNLMKDLDRDRIMEHMNDHYLILSEILNSYPDGLLSEDELKKATDYLKTAMEVTTNAVTEISLSSKFQEGKHSELRIAYLEALIKSQTREAHDVINEAKKQGLSLMDIYEEILAKVMVETGDLWHKNIITIDKEHYITSVTQSVLSGFYDEIFSKPRKNKRIVSCAVGSELHEMGARMLSDMFEYQGWDSYYLGAALPEASILEAIKEHQPDIVALSVTMPLYLPTCENIVKAVKEKYPSVKIAVGGQAFKNTEKLWEMWNVDYYSATADVFVNWAEKTYC